MAIYTDDVRLNLVVAVADTMDSIRIQRRLGHLGRHRRFRHLAPTLVAVQGTHSLWDTPREMLVAEACRRHQLDQNHPNCFDHRSQSPGRCQAAACRKATRQNRRRMSGRMCNEIRRGRQVRWLLVLRQLQTLQTGRHQWRAHQVRLRR